MNRWRRLVLLGIISLLSLSCFSQNLSANWEELTGPDFDKALQQAKGVCLLPFGIVEKHGPSGPLGTDLINVRYASFSAAKQEYAIVFPPYYFGQIAEARHQPGTLAYPARMQLELLQATTDEMARNGCKKVMVVNGHGGNSNLLRYFAQAQLDSPKDYVVYAYFGSQKPPAEGAGAPSGPNVDGHAGEGELSSVMASRPELVHPDRAALQSGADLDRLKNLPPSVYTGIWWYAKFPNHYEGNAAHANSDRGKTLMDARIRDLVEAIRAVKADDQAPRLQQEFFNLTPHPEETKQ